MDSITWVLPVRNEQTTIASCLNSLLDQKVGGQILVMNDASEDNTGRILSAFKSDKSVTILTNENQMGAAWCRNTMNKIANGSIIAVCDSEYYFKDRGNVILEFFEKNPEKGVFYSGVNCQDSKIRDHIWKQEGVVWDFKSKCPISHPSVAYRKEVALKYPYRERSKETDLYEFMLLDMHNGGVQFGGCPDAFLLKLEGNSNRDKKEAWELKNKLYTKYFKKKKCINR